MTVWHRPLDADIVPLARFQLKQKQDKSDAVDPKEMNGVSSAGQSMSSHEDLLESEALGAEERPGEHVSSTISPRSSRYAQNVTRFGSIQPNRNVHQHSRTNHITQSATNLQHKKVEFNENIDKNVYFLTYHVVCRIFTSVLHRVRPIHPRNIIQKCVGHHLSKSFAKHLPSWRKMNKSPLNYPRQQHRTFPRSAFQASGPNNLLKNATRQTRRRRPAARAASNVSFRRL